MTDHSMVQRDPGAEELCGAFGFCIAPKGHNIGKPDVPENHQWPAATPSPWRPQDHVPPQRSYVSLTVAQQMIEAGTKGGVEAALAQNLQLTGKLTQSEISRGILGAMLEQLVREVRATGGSTHLRGDLLERCIAALNVHAR